MVGHTNVELKGLDDRRHPLAGDAEVRPVAGDIDRADTHPLGLGDGDRCLAAALYRLVGDEGLVVDHRQEHPLPGQPGESPTRQTFEGPLWVERPGVVVRERHRRSP